ncbi:TetR/AcrR family transcriptional regulator [Actinocorallia sp. A-T 12471]|uniref:TetR/AcrR family transcriptional regulator n=1 Tax=Actinocorallia sp. A-T 12471 TaxID=3089813 RepID=UPI0029D3B3E8|nr:TetR/AcrR family transcriptional regulator [Actinocorallia sp. A-T 12471]MDX6741117.1 TetR/AcrR family transcriptional regulator [Actinocorallia sp. A-T 12471]
MSSPSSPHADARLSPAERAVRRRLAGLEEAAAADVRALMDAGLALMVERGDGRGPRVADIVAAAGLSNDAFYRYFSGKDALVEAIVDRGAQTLAAYVARRVAAAPDPASAIRAGVVAVLKQVRDADLARQTRAVLGNSLTMAAGSAHVSVRLVDELAAVFAPHVAALGGPESAARTIASSVMGALQYHLFKADAPDQSETDALITFLLKGTTP